MLGACEFTAGHIVCSACIMLSSTIAGPHLLAEYDGRKCCLLML